MTRSTLIALLAMIFSIAGYAQAPISGPVTVCAGNTVTLTDADPGGSWTSSDPAIASITSSGAATGVVAGSATITDSLGGTSVTASFTVYAVPAPIVESSTTFCIGATATCTDPTPGGTWSAA